MSSSILDNLLTNRLRNIEDLLRKILAEVRDLVHNGPRSGNVQDTTQDDNGNDVQGAANSNGPNRMDNFLLIIIVFVLFLRGGVAVSNATLASLADIVQALRDLVDED